VVVAAAAATAGKTLERAFGPAFFFAWGDN
jgi:hypothetical protein